MPGEEDTCLRWDLTSNQNFCCYQDDYFLSTQLQKNQLKILLFPTAPIGQNRFPAQQTQDNVLLCSFSFLILITREVNRFEQVGCCVGMP